ncbi:hypothetical protein GCM10007941_06250 [Amphritea balenae]|nr:hypothetical protein GCM10007941_06250 [Amphritea balenae]
MLCCVFVTRIIVRVLGYVITKVKATVKIKYLPLHGRCKRYKLEVLFGLVWCVSVSVVLKEFGISL